MLLFDKIPGNFILAYILFTEKCIYLTYFFNLILFTVKSLSTTSEGRVKEIMSMRKHLMSHKHENTKK
jgi:hypothetical protein